MYRNFMVKQIKTKAEFNRITKVLKKNRMAYYMHTDIENDVILERDGNYYKLGVRKGEKNIATDLKTLISEGLTLWVPIGNYKYRPTRRYDICKELGFKLEGEA